ncbi:MAG: trypsin-like peptidase domain-containing protein [Spirochaetaceae bacterium]|jgi:S1-C subfamily serine protease|nr:trypsin-like peptidase domain-containing protein [Spirochaetaceae bacterium]
MNKFFAAACAALVLVIFSCETVKKAQYGPVNYTKDDVRLAEIKRIEGDAGTNPVRSLWRAWLLKDAVAGDESIALRDTAAAAQGEALFSRMADLVNAGALRAVGEKKYYEALMYLNALEAVGAPVPSGYTSARVKDLLKEQTAVFARAEETAPPPAARSIKGTVTVWLDLGIKVERGMGYANSALGSGFFIGEQGYIITNYHVIQSEVDPAYEGFSRLYVKLAGDPDTKIPARVIGWDPLLDLALLKAEVKAPHVFSLGSSLGLNVGDRVRAIGSPLGLESTITSGIVSSVSRKLLSVAPVIQIDAAVNSGNSGGPLIDENGNVQAIVFAGLLQFEGLNFAIPVEYLLLDLPGFISGGKVEHGWLGGFGHTWRGDSGQGEGVAVQYVMPGSSLAYAGLEAGDVITAFNGAPALSIETLQNEILKGCANSIATVQGVKAGGETFSRPVYLDARPDEPVREMVKRDVAAKYFIPTFGMELIPTSTTNKRRYSVKSLIRGGIADEAGFSENDPVEVLKTRVVEKKEEESGQSYLYAELYTKKRKNGYLDVNLAIGAPLDNPYYF